MASQLQVSQRVQVPENFDPEIGKQVAYDNAREKIWLLEGYLLKEKLHQDK